jgi:2'-hydroxyisoflavone reductase
MASRRDFIRTSTVSLGLLGGGLPSFAASSPERRGESGTRPASAPLAILILGGTGFTGPFQVKYAVERGHKVTVFNRGKRQAELPAGVEHLHGDRSTGDLAALKGRTWDVVIDNPTMLPRWVKDAGEILGKAAGRYIFISTISVFGEPKSPPDENTAVERWTRNDDPLAIRQVSQDIFQHYGALKALSEREAEKWFPGKTIVIRPGLIVGPRDDTDRFSYWPIRIDRGGEVLCPGAPTDPVQVVDGRDLAEWTVRMAESGAPGIYNATGPRARLSIAEMLYGIRAATSGDNEVRFTWVPADFLAANKVQPWGDMPVWIPPGGEGAGIAETRIAKAVAAGLTFRPLAVTARDTIDWFKSLPVERQAKLRAGVTKEREAEVLAAWHAREGQARRG